MELPAIVFFLICVLPAARMDGMTGTGKTGFNALTEAMEIVTHLGLHHKGFYHKAMDAYFWTTLLEEFDQDKDDMINKTG